MIGNVTLLGKQFIIIIIIIIIFHYQSQASTKKHLPLHIYKPYQNIIQ